MSAINKIGFVLVLTVFVAQQVRAVQDDEAAVLQKIEDKNDRIMTPKLLRLFNILQTCTKRERSDFNRCVASAIVDTESRLHKGKIRFIMYWFKRLVIPCHKIVNLVEAHKTLLADQTKQAFSFSDKIIELIRNFQFCRRLDESNSNLRRTMQIVFEEYEKRSHKAAKVNQ